MAVTYGISYEHLVMAFNLGVEVSVEKVRKCFLPSTNASIGIIGVSITKEIEMEIL
jgi:hypothetical protein